MTARDAKQARLSATRLNSTITAGGMLLQQALGFLGGVFVAKLLGPAGYGEVSVLRSLLTLLIVFTPLGLDLALFRILPRFDHAPQDQVLHFGRFRIMVAAVGVTMTAISALLVGPLLNKDIYNYTDFSIHFAITVMAIPFATDLLLLNAWYRVQGNIIPILLILLYFQPVVRTGLNVSAVYLGYGVTGVVVGTTVAYLAAFLLGWLYFAWMRRYTSKHSASAALPTWSESWRQFTEAPPMALNLLTYNVMRTADVVIVGAMSTVAAVGEYAVVSNLAQLVPVAALSLTQTLGPAVARRLQTDDRQGLALEINNVIRLSSILASFVFGGIAGFGSHLDAVFGAAYQPSPALTLLIPLGYLASATLAPTSYALTMSGRARIDLHILIVSACVLVISCVLLTSIYGPIGAAISVLIGYTLCNIMRIVVVSRTLKVTIGRWRDLVPPIVALTLATVVNYLVVPVNAKLLPLIGGCIVYALLYGGIMSGKSVAEWFCRMRIR